MLFFQYIVERKQKISSKVILTIFPNFGNRKNHQTGKNRRTLQIRKTSIKGTDLLYGIVDPHIGPVLRVLSIFSNGFVD